MSKTPMVETTGQTTPPKETLPQLRGEDFAPQLVWLFLTFVALYVILSRLALPRIATVLEEREDRIAADLDAAEQLKAETEAAMAAYEQALAEARAEAHAIAQKTREDVTAEMEAERAKVDAQIAEMTAEAEARIAEAKSSAMAKVEEIAGQVVGDISERLLGETVSQKEVTAALETVRAK